MLPFTLNGFYDRMPRFHLAINPFARVKAVIHRMISNKKLCDITADKTARFVDRPLNQNIQVNGINPVELRKFNYDELLR